MNMDEIEAALRKRLNDLQYALSLVEMAKAMCEAKARWDCMPDLLIEEARVRQKRHELALELSRLIGGCL